MTDIEKPEWGWVYVMQLHREAVKEIKIGFTTMTPERRALSLTKKTGIKHHVTWANWVWNPVEVEEHFMEMLSEHRGSLGNEYFCLKSMNDADAGLSRHEREGGYLFRNIIRPLETFGNKFRETFPLRGELGKRTKRTKR